MEDPAQVGFIVGSGENMVTQDSSTIKVYGYPYEAK